MVRCRAIAVIVGINQYKDPAVPELRGSENDVALMAHTLVKRYGFAESSLKVLIGKQATRRAILDAFAAWLIGGVEPGDVVCFCFSGHGAQTPDKHADEPDGLDEFLLPYDSDKKAWKGRILDDEIHELIAHIPTDNVTLVVDACHSGTMTRGGLISTPKFVPAPAWVLEEGELKHQSRGVGAPRRRAAGGPQPVWTSPGPATTLTQGNPSASTRGSGIAGARNLPLTLAAPRR